MRKRIAVITAQVEEIFLKEFIEGFFEKSFSDDYDVCVFASFDKEPDSSLKEVGETNIFNLINWSYFDGFVVMPDVLQVPGLMIQIEEKLKKNCDASKVLYVDQTSECFPYILMPQAEPMACLTKHMIEVHGYKDIVFIDGDRWHIHSRERLLGFTNCMEEHGLIVSADNIYYGNYWFDSGIRIIEEMLSDGRKMPEAFICANDYMALGACEALVRNGYKIPDDVAVVGFDSCEAGRNCPSPLTSVPLPFRDYGIYAAECIDNLTNGRELGRFEYDWSLFVGESCGCKNYNSELVKRNTHSWNISQYNSSFFSRYNGLTEDLLLQTSIKSLVDVMQTYSYQIREFESYFLCLNEPWTADEICVEDTEIRKGYTNKICPVLICGPTGKGADKVNFKETFSVKEMLPDISKECDHPRGFIFSPVCFEDISFGYSVISYGCEAKCYDEAYYMWLKTIMLSLECLRRNIRLQRAKEEAEEVQIYDVLTGMFNYEGFTKHARPMIDRGKLNGLFNTILTIEIDGIDEINSEYGRKVGDSVMHEVAMMVFASADEGAMCCRLGGDVITVAELTEDISSDKAMAVLSRFTARLNEYNKASKHPLKIYTGISTARVDSLVQMEDLVNDSVSQKNGNKSKEIKMQALHLTPEEVEKLSQVRRILDDNLFDYHFQPIVSARDGSIYAYEALMRPRTNPFVSPLDVLKCAEHLERLYDVEKATFYNVLNIALENMEIFTDKKIFVNSIPGNQLMGEDARGLQDIIKKLAGNLVVELTEQAEASDDELSLMKNWFIDMGVETAVDDYGTGYSNIVNLLRYMPNYVKIDRMLLSEIQNNPQKIHFVKDIVAFAKENKFKVLAEGIETKEELETVIKLGVDLIQGYYTARPNAEILKCIPDEIKTEIIQFNKVV